MSSMFRAPAARAIKTLDRSLFFKALPTAAALVTDNKLLSKYRKNLEHTGELLHLQKLSPIATYSDPAQAEKREKKCFLLKPKVEASDSSTWSEVLREARDSGDLEVVPYTVNFDYDLWSYSEYMTDEHPLSMSLRRTLSKNSGRDEVHSTRRAACGNPFWLQHSRARW